MNNETLFLIVVHNKNIIDFFEENKKYQSFKNYKYLLVGNHQEDYNCKKIIQCNTLPNNIESKSNYLAYTGWYAAAHNPGIIDDYEYVCFLEYDTDPNNDFSLESFTEQIHNEKLDCYGINSIDNIRELFDRSQTTFNGKLIKFLIKNNIKEIKPNNTDWIVTNNIVVKTEFFKKYFNDPLTIQFLEYLDNDKMSGHFLERYLSVYCYIKNIKFGIIKNSNLVHKGYDSHNTQGIYNSHRGYERFKTINKISD